MVQPLRILYGLHESFVLFPYDRGGRRIRLVVRRKLLEQLLLTQGICDKPLPIGAPLVLGEIVDCIIQQNAFVPIVCSGHFINALKRQRVEWTVRHHRVVGFGGGQSLRFESGSKTIFPAHTAFYSIELLMQLVREGIHESNPRAGVPQR